MAGSVIFIIAYFAGWVLYFQLIQRPLFMLYNVRGTDRGMLLKNLWKISRYGLKSDIIIASYMTALPLIAATIQAYVPYSFLPQFMAVYNLTAGCVIALGSVADTALYRFWKFKLDSSVLPYLRSLRGAFASVSTSYITMAFAAYTAMAFLTVWWTGVWSETGMSLKPYIAEGVVSKSLTGCVSVLFMGLLFIMIRGLGRRPNNPSISFFSNRLFFNHCALNPIYSLIYSLSVNDKIEGAFHKFSDDECHREFSKLFPRDSFPTDRLFNTTRPNILFIIWESLNAKFVGELGGDPNVTPNINRLSHEGVFFTRVDCNSFRTDRGLVALLSGYLAQPTTSVIRMTKKLPNLPAFPRKFKDLGYSTMAVHGGDLNIFHKAEYYLSVGHDTLVSDKDFPKNSPKGKWGVHDGVVFDWLYDNITEKTACGEKWYTTFQTLSSHEDWKVPYNRIPDDEIANSFAYVDDAFGRLVDRLRETPAWDNLLIVVTGDHGCNAGEPLSHDKYSHIPLLMLGGAVKAPRRIDTIMSQSDIASTILGQLDMPHDEFIFSRDVMSESYKYPFSYHTFINGFMFRDATGFTVVDNVTDSAISNPDKDREHKGRIILQYLYEDLAKR